MVFCRNLVFFFAFEKCSSRDRFEHARGDDMLSGGVWRLVLIEGDGGADLLDN